MVRSRARHEIALGLRRPGTTDLVRMAFRRAMTERHDFWTLFWFGYFISGVIFLPPTIVYMIYLAFT